MSSNETKDDEAYQCLSGTLLISSKNKNQNLAENKNHRKDPTKIKESPNASSVAYCPTEKRENNTAFTQNNEHDGQQTDTSNNGVNQEQACTYAQTIGVCGSQPVKQSSTCCVIIWNFKELVVV